MLLEISKLGIKSKISSLSLLNLNGLMSMLTAGVFCFEGNVKKAKEMCENSLKFLIGDEVMVRPLIYKLLKVINNSEFLESDTFLSKDFDSIILVSCLIPYITVGTPSIKISDKKIVSSRSTSRNSSFKSNKRISSTPQSRIKVKNTIIKS